MDVSRKAPPKRGHFLLTVLAALVLTTLRSALATLLSALTGLLGINISAQSTEMSLSIVSFR
jgi:hypothetical protein